MPNTVFWR